MTRTRTLISAASVLLIVSVFAACGEDGEGGAGGEGTPITVTMTDFEFELDSDIPSETVTFTVENAGDLEHEMEIFAGDIDASDIPVEGEKADPEAAGLEEIAEIEGIEGGESDSLTVDLSPGPYMMICNEEGHFEEGMWLEFEVE